MTSGTPAANTTSAACGSTWTLNSAAGVMLPSPIAPPISTISRMRGTTSGAFCSAVAMLVSGPVGQSVTVPGG